MFGFAASSCNSLPHTSSRETNRWTGNKMESYSLERRVLVSSGRQSRWCRLYTLIVAVSVLCFSTRVGWLGSRLDSEELARRANILNQCRYIKMPAGPPANFHARSESDRFSPDAKPTLIRNATIWTSGRNGTEVIQGDLLLLKGLIRGVGSVAPSLVRDLDIEVLDANGAWVTPGIVDIHSHLGVGSAPELGGKSFLPLN